MKLKHYKQPQSDLWKGRSDDVTDSDTHRLYNVIQTVPLNDLTKCSKQSFALLGFCCDEGVRRNQGRVGAFEGPASLRKALANMPVHFGSDVTLYDVGDVVCDDGDLESAQQDLAKAVSHLLSLSIQPLVMGGGHEVAYGHGKGVFNVTPKDKTVGIINFDAHFDLREPVNGKGSSGTPFLQLAKDCDEQGRDFKYLCLGVKKSSNTKRLFKTADELNVDYVFCEDMGAGQSEVAIKQIDRFIASVDSVYLTLCLDVFTGVPGVSAVNGAGLSFSEFMVFLNRVLSSGKVISTDVAELAPCFDQNQMTAKLAAEYLFRVLSHD